VRHLDLLLPGARHFRNGQPRKGFLVHGLALALLVAAGATPWLHSPLGFVSFLGVVLLLSLGSWLAARRHRTAAPAALTARLRAWLAVPIVLVVALSAVPPLREHVLGLAVYRIPPGSRASAPTLLPCDRFLVDLRYYDRRDPRPGDLVLFRAPDDPGRTYVKRVARIEPDGAVFVVGDNREASRDSRHFGPVPVSAITGRALFVVFSEECGRIGTDLR